MSLVVLVALLVALVSMAVSLVSLVSIVSVYCSIRRQSRKSKGDVLHYDFKNVK